MLPHAAHMLVRIIHEERLAEAEAARRYRVAKTVRRRARRAETQPVPADPAPSGPPVCSSA
jgi:hypothetical protein